MHKVIPSPSVKKRISWVSPSTVSNMFSKERVPRDFVYLKLDMDADDCATLVAILASGYRPRVVQIEMTPEIPYQVSGSGLGSGFKSGSTISWQVASARAWYKLR